MEKVENRGKVFGKDKGRKRHKKWEDKKSGRGTGEDEEKGKKKSGKE